VILLKNKLKIKLARQLVFWFEPQLITAARGTESRCSKLSKFILTLENEKFEQRITHLF